MLEQVSMAMRDCFIQSLVLLSMFLNYGNKYQIYSLVSCKYMVTVKEHVIIFGSQQKCRLGSFH